MKMIMAKTLSEIELTDHNKALVVREGALQPLLQLLSNPDVQTKEIAVKALLQLSSLPENGLQMIREGVAQSLFELLYRHSLQSTALREQAAATMMHLAMSTTHQQAGEVQVSLIDSEDDVFKFFALISFTGPDIQSKILKTFLAMSQSPSGLTVRERLRQVGIFFPEVMVLVHYDCGKKSFTIIIIVIIIVEYFGALISISYCCFMNTHIHGYLELEEATRLTR